MTNEEAIKIIKNYDVNGCGYCHQGGDEVEEAFQMAISALENKKEDIAESEPQESKDNELQAITDFLNDIEEVAEKHGLNIGIYENNMKETESFNIVFIPALGYDAQFLRIGKKSEEEK